MTVADPEPSAIARAQPKFSRTVRQNSRDAVVVSAVLGLALVVVAVVLGLRFSPSAATARRSSPDDVYTATRVIVPNPRPMEDDCLDCRTAKAERVIPIDPAELRGITAEEASQLIPKVRVTLPGDGPIRVQGTDHDPAVASARVDRFVIAFMRGLNDDFAAEEQRRLRHYELDHDPRRDAWAAAIAAAPPYSSPEPATARLVPPR